MGRTGLQRLEAIEPAIKAKDEFMARVKDAEGDAVRCADLMVEAINMQYEANGKDTVGNDGRAFIGIEHVFAAHCMFAARDAYLKARGSNQP